MKIPENKYCAILAFPFIIPYAYLCATLMLAKLLCDLLSAVLDAIINKI